MGGRATGDLGGRVGGELGGSAVELAGGGKLGCGDFAGRGAWREQRRRAVARILLGSFWSSFKCRHIYDRYM